MGTLVSAAPTAPKPSLLEKRELSDQTQKGKPGPPSKQVAAYNDLDFHAHSKFFAKSLTFNQVMNVADKLGPFSVNFECTSNAIKANITISNTNLYDITFHGNYISGANSSEVHLLSAGESISLRIAEWGPAYGSGNQVGAPDSKGAIMTSNGYFLALSNADSYIMTVSNDDNDDLMPNSDCTVAGFMEFAHPKGGQYYSGFFYEDVLLERAKSESMSGAAMFGGVAFGVIVGAVLVVAAALMATKNRKQLLEAAGVRSSMGECFSMEDTSTTGLTSGAKGDAAPNTSI